MNDSSHTLPPEDDLATLRAIAEGDERALRWLYDRHAGWIAVRLRRSLSREATEDVLQETFLAVWRGAGAFRGDGDVAAWMWGIARRRSMDWMRKHGRVDIALDEIGEQRAIGVDPADAVARQQELGRALAAVGATGSMNETIARRALVEDRPLVEIAEELQMPVGTIKSRLHRIRKTLAAHREEEALR